MSAYNLTTCDASTRRHIHMCMVQLYILRAFRTGRFYSTLLLPGKSLGRLDMKSLHLQELSWEAAGKVSALITQDRENKAPTCNRKHFLSLSPQCSSYGKYVVGCKLSISNHQSQRTFTALATSQLGRINIGPKDNNR